MCQTSALSAAWLDVGAKMDEASLDRWHHVSEHTFRQGPCRSRAFVAEVLVYDELLIRLLPTTLDRRP